MFNTTVRKIKLHPYIYVNDKNEKGRSDWTRDPYEVTKMSVIQKVQSNLKF